MNISIAYRFLVAISAAFLLGSCSGGIGGSGVTDDSGGTGGSGISFGVISGFGSIVVNGVRFDTSNATIVIEGMEQAGKGDLTALGYPDDKGRVVRVEGTIGKNGAPSTAARVVYNDNVEGPITNITPKGTNTIEVVVLGQTVIVDDSTRLQPATITIGDLTKNNLVEVSGLADTMGVIRATHVKKNGDFVPGDNVDIKGIIKNLTGDTFTINALTVKYDDLTDMTALPGGLAERLFVEVKGVTVDGGLLTATKIELEDEIGTENADEAEVEGFITGFILPSAFTVGNQLVATDANTQFKGGLPEDIALGVKLEVEGILMSGVLFADEISFGDSVKLEADTMEVVPDIDNPTSNGTLELAGLPGITVEVNGLTELKGVERFNTIQKDDHVRVRGRERTGTPGHVIATELIVQKSANSRVELQGTLTDISDPFLTILGITIDSSTVQDFEGLDEQPMTQAEFLSVVKTGDIVKAKGTWDNGTADWKKLEVEDDD